MSFSIEIKQKPGFHYGSHINGVPFIDRITVKNTNTEDSGALTLLIESEPLLFKAYTIEIPPLVAGGTFRVEKIELDYLAEATILYNETVKGTIRYCLKEKEYDSLLFGEEKEIDIYPIDENSNYLKDSALRAMFVTPNHPQIRNLVKEISDKKGNDNKDFSIVGYQWGKEEILSTLECAFEVIREKEISYVISKAGFLSGYQRIRLVDEIMREKLANCLDMTYLFASVMEALGLNPLIAVTENHAMAGFWLEKKTLPESYTTDADLVRKSITENEEEMMFLECTLCEKGDRSSFKDAMDSAMKKLRSRDETITVLIDVKRARLAGITPVPARISAEEFMLLYGDENAFSYPGINKEEELESSVDAPTSLAGDITDDKLIRWKSKLLDTTAGSSLVNLKVGGSSKKAGYILTDQLFALYEQAISKNVLTLSPCPAEYQMPVGAGENEEDTEAASLDDMAAASVKCKNIAGNGLMQNIIYLGYEKEVMKTLMERLRSEEKEHQSQYGTGILYLSLGAVKWLDEKSSKSYFAPVLLLPVKLVKNGERYQIAFEDSEIFLNAAVTEVLKSRFGLMIQGLFPIPLRQDGKPDLALILRNLRKICKNCKQTEVFEYATIGTFRFSQYLLWNDLDKHESVFRKHPVIRALLNNEPLEKKVEQAHCVEVFQPIPADQSQIEAVEAALGDSSMVLHGPPGTGKSQTITMMLANYIGNGQSVLFSAEKDCALSVVYDRISTLGLKEFCMPIGADSSKKNAIEQFLYHYEDLMELPLEEETGYDKLSGEIRERRADLENQITAFGKKTEDGKTALALLAENLSEIAKEEAEPAKEPACPATRRRGSGRVASLAAGGTGSKSGTLVSGNPAAGSGSNDCNGGSISGNNTGTQADLKGNLSKHNEDHKEAMKVLMDGDYAHLLRLLEDTFYMGNVLGDPKAYPLHDFKGLKYTYKLSEKLAESLNEYHIWLEDMECLFENIHILMEETASSGKRKGSTGLSIDSRREPDQKLLFDQLLHYGELPEELRQVSNLYIKLLTWVKFLGVKEPVEKLQKLTHDNFTELDLREILGKWNKIRHKTDTNSKIARLDMKQEYRKYMRNPGFTEKDFDDALLYGILIKESNLPVTLSYSFNLTKEETMELLPLVEKYYRDGLKLPVTEKTGPYWEEYSGIIADYAAFAQNAEKQLTCEIPFWMGEADIPSALAEAEQWEASLGGLREWCDYSELRDDCIKAGLTSFVEAFEAGLDSDIILKQIDKERNSLLFNRLFEGSRELAAFSGLKYQKAVDDYRGLMKEYLKACAKEIRERQIKRIREVLSDPAYAQEKVLLKKMIVQKGKGLSIRQIFEGAGHLLVKLTPVIIATPLQAAQCIPVEEIYFDHMVLDEASQLQTARAVGLIARSRHSIVVGDPNQMPPTDFFASASEEDEDFALADQESILMDFIALDMPDRYLKWHYRSHHESLISFSNESYYGGRMITFPSVDENNSRVHVIRTNGIYDRGHGMTNRIEAKTLVDYLVDKMSNGDSRSYGIITFNKRQQMLIESLIEKAEKGNASFATSMEALREKGEELFVRNLESVQGDERDVILFSVGYGRDAEGRILMNFGPLARNGGYRRLNVAITRARDEMILFTSMDAKDMQVHEGTPRGVKDLRRFIKFAEMQTKAGYTADKTVPGEGLGKVICELLKENQIPYSLKVGSSELKVDIAVYSEKKEHFVLGIMTDSKAIGGKFSVYDGEIGLMNKLEADGWKLYRTFTLDWIGNPKKEKERLLSAVKEALKEG